VRSTYKRYAKSWKLAFCRRNAEGDKRVGEGYNLFTPVVHQLDPGLFERGSVVAERFATSKTTVSVILRTPVLLVSCVLLRGRGEGGLVESWRRAWQGSQLPVKPFEDIEWVEQHREWISALLDTSSTSSEAAAENYQAIQAQWMLDHVRKLEEVDPALAAEVRRLSERVSDE
jgi:hypothetical protein